LQLLIEGLGRWLAEVWFLASIALLMTVAALTVLTTAALLEPLF
jgi:hypothetical protein